MVSQEEGSSPPMILLTDVLWINETRLNISIRQPSSAAALHADLETMPAYGYLEGTVGCLLGDRQLSEEQGEAGRASEFYPNCITQFLLEA